MTLKEIRKRNKAEMTPLRYRFNHLIAPIYVSVMALFSVVMIIVFTMVKPEEWALLFAGLAMAALICMFLHGAVLKRKELNIELDRWSYLFKKGIPFEGETLETDDPETGNAYVLSQKGVKVILPKSEGQVFVETYDNEYFLPWSDVEIVVATDNFACRVRLAVAVIDVSRRSVDGNYVPAESEVHFLPFEEELVGFLQKFALEEKLSVEWRYIQAKPKDAFKQILGKGYIRTLLDESGKRIKREHADDLYKD